MLLVFEIRQLLLDKNIGKVGRTEVFILGFGSALIFIISLGRVAF